MKKGFTFLEAVLALSILSIIVVIGSGSLFANRRIQTELDSNVSVISDMLRRAQNNAITGEGFVAWGVHFDNGSEDFYQMFSGADWTDGTRHEQFTLASGLVFEVPTEGANAEILFDLRSGKRISATDNIIIRSSVKPDLKKTISVSGEGKVSSD